MLDQLEEQISNEVDEEMWDDIAPVTQHTDTADREKKNIQTLKYRDKLPQTTTLGLIWECLLDQIFKKKSYSIECKIKSIEPS